MEESVNYRKRSLLLFAFFVLMYGAQSVTQGYMSAVLDEYGFTPTQMGLLLSIPPLVALVAQPLMGVLADKAKTKNRVLLILFLLSGITLFLYNAGTGFLFFAVIMSVYTFLENPITPIVNAVTLESVPKQNYSRIRAGGTIGYALVVFGCSGLIKNSIDIIFYLGGALTVLVAFFTLTLPKVPGGSHGKRMNPLVLLKDKRILRLMPFMLVLGISFGFYSSFYPVHLKALAPENAMSLVGLANGFAAACEIPFLLFGNKLIKKFGFSKVLVLLGAVTSVRWLLYALIGNAAWLTGLQALHGLGQASILTTVCQQMDIYTDDKYKASGQALVALSNSTVGRIIGATVGGWVCEFLTVPQVFAILFVLCSVTVAVYAAVATRAEKKERSAQLDAN